MPRRKAILSASLALILIPLLAAASGFASETPFDPKISAGPVLGDPSNFGAEPAKLEPSSVPHSPFVVGQPKPVPPFPILLNRLVQEYVDDYVRQPASWDAGVERSRPFFLEMTQALRAKGVPDDLLYLSFAESDFSEQGKGPWQFNKGTAQKYGLRVDRWVDERRDPVLSTEAAAEYLSDLHEAAGFDWRVAIVGWNGGDLAINRFWLLRGQNFNRFMDLLPCRTRALMSRFMAFAFMAHNSTRYGIVHLDYDAPPEYHEVPVRGGTKLSQLAGSYHTTIAKLHDLNPALLRDRIPPDAHGYTVRVPHLRTAFAE
ncbi:MAG: transglycosylase SLT domain-containing protein [Deltaproteobacteria bacterium]|nr:transglycosylase SLT domain-containing protein [Deltaproteobacteria bacterium]